MTFTPDTNQSLVFDHGWSLPVAVAPTMEVANAKAEALNAVMEWDQFDADHAAGVDFITGEVEFPEVGYYYDADRMTLVRDEYEPTMDEMISAIARLMNGNPW